KWFKQTFKEAGRWPLPDGSEAILYQCKPDPQRVPDVGIFNMSLQELQLPNVMVHDLELKAIPLSAADTQVGRMKELRLKCSSAEYKGIRFENVDIRLEKPQINTALFFQTQEIQLNSLGSLDPQVSVNADAVLGYAAKKAKWL